MKLKTFFSRQEEKRTLDLIQKHQKFDPVIRQLKSWHKYETKPIKADTTILGKKTFFDISENLNTSINENTDILEYQTSYDAYSFSYLSLSTH